MELNQGVQAGDYHAASSQVLWRLVWARRRLVAAVTMCCAAVATVVAFVVTPWYRAEVVMIPADSAATSGMVRALGELGGLAALAGVSLGGGNDEQGIEALALLRSRQFASDFIRDENLLPVLFYKRWDAKRKQWKVPLDEVPTEGDAYDLFNKKVRRVAEDRKTGLVTLTIEWCDREAAARWATELVHRVNRLMRARAIAESDASIEQLRERLATTSIQPLQQSIAELLEAQIKRRTFAGVRTDYAFRIVDPAVVADKKDRVYPRRSLFLIVGGLAGFLFGVLAALAIELAFAPPARAVES